MLPPGWREEGENLPEGWVNGDDVVHNWSSSYSYPKGCLKKCKNRFYGPRRPLMHFFQSLDPPPNVAIPLPNMFLNIGFLTSDLCIWAFVHLCIYAFRGPGGP